MPHAKLIKSEIDKLPFAEKGVVNYFDTELRGFGLRISQTKKTFFVQRDINTKTHVVNIGSYGIWTPDQARKDAKDKLHLLSKGIDPNEAKKEKQAKNMTLRELADEFYVARTSLKPDTIKAYEGYLTYHLKDWLDKPVIEITEDSFSKRYRHIGESRGKTVANCVRRTLSSMLNYGIAAHKFFTKNPVLIISETKAAYKSVPRRNYIKPSQLKAWFEAVNNLPNRTYRDYILFVAFTGLRRNEAASLRWSSVDFAERTFSISNTKSGRPLTQPMSDFVYDLLVERRKLAGGSPFVFASTGASGYLAEPKKGIDAVRKATGIQHTIHDLRRGYATYLESIEVSAYAIKALLNHTASDVTGGHYVVIDVERLRKPVQALAAYILEQAGVQKPLAKQD